MRETGNIERCLEELGCAIVPVKGTSMWPLLKEGKCRVQILSKNGHPFRKGDIVLYRREDDTLVLHRIMKITENNRYLVCGDHQWKLEEEIGEEQILAVAQGFYRNGRFVDDQTWWYRCYRIIWNGNRTVRRCCLAFLRLGGLEKKYLS